MQCCRPVRNQQEIYNGKDRIHGLKYQNLTLPNGIIAHVHGPLDGRHHDSMMWGDSGVEHQIRGLMSRINGRQLVLYGDKAYALSDVLQTPVRVQGHQPNVAILSYYNQIMSSLRVTNEWNVGLVSRRFAFNKYPQNLKLLLSPIGIYYLVANIFTNCHTCLHGNATSKYFDLAPPSLEEYLQ